MAVKHSGENRVGGWGHVRGQTQTVVCQREKKGVMMRVKHSGESTGQGWES